MAEGCAFLRPYCTEYRLDVRKRTITARPQHFAIYCALRYEYDFSAGIIAAVNHDGDSDSTGAVTGNILGAINGYDSIEAKWKNHLELMDVLLEMSDDLCQGCLMSEYDPYCDPVRARKYIDAQWKG